MNLKSTVTLNNGVEMPQFGLGVFKAISGDETANAVRWALEAGYAAIDTASFYDNEESVGRGIRESGVDRKDIFITTKCWNSEQGYDNALRAFDSSVKKLGIDYLDLYLVHWPVPSLFKETWKAFEKLYADKRVRAIGVSNFEPHHLDDLIADATVKPVVNQIEQHPYLQQNTVRGYCDAQDIRVTAWSPIARGKVLDDPVLQEIATAHGKSPVQVTLRWQIQLGIITIPKSVHKDRIVANADIFDFELSDDEMRRIAALEVGEASRLGPHPDRITDVDLPERWSPN
ncbi:MAG: aldo/keto reductase [Alkalispirochaeta sp.]